MKSKEKIVRCSGFPKGKKCRKEASEGIIDGDTFRPLCKECRAKSRENVSGVRHSQMGWTVMGVLQLTCTSKGRSLSVMVAPVSGEIGWSVVAIESNDRVKTIDDVFEDHGHKTVANCRSMPEAVEVAEKYSVQWQRKKGIGKCGCDEIG